MKKLSIICLTVLMAFAMASCNKTYVYENEVYSSTVDVASSQWYWDNNTSWRVDITYKSIDAAVNAHGAVLVYMESDNTWRQIPMTFYYSQQNDDGTFSYFSSSLEVSTYQEGLSIFWTENDFYNGYRPESHRFKIVVIPANIYQSRQDVNYEDYGAVKEAFQLAE